MAREIVFKKNLGTNGINSRKSVTESQAKFLVYHGIADYTETKSLVADKPKESPKKAGRPKKNTYQTKVMTPEE